jgi:uncharacterized peroxidase-related enzyme
LDDALAEAIRTDYRTADLSPPDRAMLDYVAQLTQDATRLSPESLACLRQVGFTDEAIVQMTLIASWFNYINRVADALGFGRS